MKTLTLKDFATYRGAVTARAKALLAQAKGTRWDRLAGRVAGGLGFVGGLAAYAGYIPGKTGALAAGVCAVCAMLAPRAGRAAGLLQAAYGQNRPLLPVLLEVAQVFANPSAIIAQAKSAAQEAQAEQAKQQAAQIAQQQADLAEQAVLKAEAEKATLVGDVADKVVEALKTGGFLPGQLSADVPAALKQFAPPAPLVAAMPIAKGQVEEIAKGQTGDAA